MKRVLRALKRVLVHDPEVVRTEKHLAFVLALRLLVVAGASAGVVAEAERILRLIGLS